MTDIQHWWSCPEGSAPAALAAAVRIAGTGRRHTALAHCLQTTL